MNVHSAYYLTIDPVLPGDVSMGLNLADAAMSLTCVSLVSDKGSILQVNIELKSSNRSKVGEKNESNVFNISLKNQSGVLLMLTLMRTSLNFREAFVQLLSANWKAVAYPRSILVQAEAPHVISRTERRWATEQSEL